MKATNSADDSDGSDGDDEEQDANKTHDEVSVCVCVRAQFFKWFTCYLFIPKND